MRPSAQKKKRLPLRYRIKESLINSAARLADPFNQGFLHARCLLADRVKLSALVFIELAAVALLALMLLRGRKSRAG